MANLAYLSLGSNIDAERCLPEGTRALTAYGVIRAVSPVLETEPLGDTDQANYLNAVIVLETPLSAADIWDQAIPDVETRLGRVRSANKNAPRTLDIDLVLFNQETIQWGRHSVPDPDICQRDFLAFLLAEVAPDLHHPLSGETLRTIADRFPPGSWRFRPDVIIHSGFQQGE